MNQSARILVLLATLNGECVVERQLRSVMAQTNVDLRVDVRDDGSTDNTRELLKTLCAHDSRLALRSGHEPSGSAAANFFLLIQGANLEGITHVAFCDQDDEWHSDKLFRAVKLLQRTGAAAYSAAVEALWPDGRRRVLSQVPHVRRADHLFEGAGQGCTFVFTVDLFRRLQRDILMHADLLPSLHYHDWTLYALSRASGALWHFDAWPCMIYHQHDSNDTGARSSTAGFARRVKLIRANWYREQVDGIVELLRQARPDHCPASAWAVLASRPASRLTRIAYVVRHGRRRGIDRVFQAAAVALGHL